MEVFRQLWEAILELIAKLVIPDWDAVVAMIPIGLAGLVALYLVWIAARFATAGPKVRGRQRVRPLPPPGVHEAAPSYAPIVAAVGSFFLFLGIVLGGIWLWVGIAALVLGLLYWGREALLDYDRVAGVERPLPASAHRAPPPGVHEAVPSFRPILVSAAAAVVFAGLVVGPWLTIAGIVLLVITLLGWLRDAGHEYRAVEEADRTGHLEPPPPPAIPTRTIAAFVLLVGAALVLDAGVLPPRSAAGEPGASPPGMAPASPGTSPGASPGASPGPTVPAADVTITARAIQFLERDVAVPAGREFTIAFVNEDANVPHNVEIKDAAGAVAFKGEIFPGVATKVYTVPALQPGAYQFICTVHPNMTGTLTAR